MYHRIENNSLTPLRFWTRVNLDPYLLLSLILLSGLGLFILLSASNGNHAMVFRQCTRLLLSYLVLFIFAQIPPHRYKTWAPTLFTLTLVLLLAVLLVGKVGKGAQRWLDFGIFRFQPSEIMKILTPMMIAWYVSNKLLPINLRDASIALLIVVTPALFIAKQPDLGTALMVVFSGITVLFFAGISYRVILAFSTLITFTTPLLWHYLHDYQKQRVLTFLNPEMDPLGTGYHIIQSKIAIGSGGLFGKGWLGGSQSHLHFLPEHTTDFIFAVLGEEFGLVGCVILIFSFTLIIVRSFYIASVAPTAFTRLLTISLTANFFLSAFVNMGMVTGILPVVGIPLPLVSYGGSSMIVFFASFGILMSIYSSRTYFRYR